eukprot:4470052-Prymnesium_polylepis.2
MCASSRSRTSGRSSSAVTGGWVGHAAARSCRVGASRSVCARCAPSGGRARGEGRSATAYLQSMPVDGGA